MRQDVVIARELTEEQAVKVTEWLDNKNLMAHYSECKEGEFEVSLHCDPENEFFRVDKILTELGSSFKEITFETIGSLEFEPEFIECDLCGERLPAEAGRCNICGAPTQPQEDESELKH